MRCKLSQFFSFTYTYVCLYYINSAQFNLIYLKSKKKYFTSYLLLIKLLYEAYIDFSNGSHPKCRQCSAIFSIYCIAQIISCNMFFSFFLRFFFYYFPIWFMGGTFVALIKNFILSCWFFTMILFDWKKL